LAFSIRGSNTLDHVSLLIFAFMSILALGIGLGVFIGRSIKGFK
jgi:hypothetical protein